MGNPCAPPERERRPIGAPLLLLVPILFASVGALALPTVAQAQPEQAGASGESDAGGSAGDELQTQDEAATAEARERYAQGAEFYRRERYAAAIAEFTEAYRLWQNPTILYALGQAYEGDAQVLNAIETYQRYVETAPEGEPRRDEAQNRIRLLNRLLATIRIQSSAPADIYVNGELVGRSPGTIRVATGRHEVELRAEGYRNSMRVLTVAAGTENDLDFDLREEETRTEVIRVTEERDAFRFPRQVFYGAAGITGASALTWVALASVTKRRANEYNSESSRSRAELSSAQDWARRSDILLGVTGGLAVTTLVIALLTQWSDEDESEGEDDDDSPEGPLDDEVAGATGPAPDANVIPTRGGAVLTVGWRR